MPSLYHLYTSALSSELPTIVAMFSIPAQEVMDVGCCVITGFPISDNLADDDSVVPQVLLTRTAYNPWSAAAIFCNTNCWAVALLVMLLPSLNHW